MKRVSVDDLIIGKKYYTKCGIWEGITTYAGCEKIGQRIKYRFTFGNVDNWQNQFNIFGTKSRVKIYEVPHNIK